MEIKYQISHPLINQISDIKVPPSPPPPVKSERGERREGERREERGERREERGERREERGKRERGGVYGIRGCEKRGDRNSGILDNRGKQ